MPRIEKKVIGKLEIVMRWHLSSTKEKNAFWRHQKKKQSAAFTIWKEICWKWSGIAREVL